MRMVFGAVSLLVVLAIVGVLAKKQLSAVSAPPTTSGTEASGVPTPAGTPKQQVDQVKKNVDALMQQPRPNADDVK